MKSMLTRHGSSVSTAVICSSLVLSAGLASAQDVTVDGVRNNDGPEGYTLLHTQVTASNWDSPLRSLANIHARQYAGSLCIHMAGKANGGAFMLFLDTKPGGVNFIPDNLITSGGEAEHINNLGASTTAGMTFEAGFNADYAIRIYGDGNDAYVNVYNLQTGVRTYGGNSGNGIADPSSGFLAASSLKTVWNEYLPGDYATADLGVEMSLNFAAIGVPQGTHAVKMTALMVNENSTYGSNQVLGSRISSTADIAGNLKTLNFETEAGTQTLSISVTNNDSDNDGIPNDLDNDDDNDGLLDVVETNTGIYVSPSDTGSNPLIADTDLDTLMDGDEVTGANGFVSNPNVANYDSMAVPGNFTTPMWQADGTGGTTMTRVDTTLTGQYQWRLDYRFTTLGSIEYKYAANGSFAKSWGDGGNNFSALVGSTGFHRFSFDNRTNAQSLQRTVFPNVAAYLAAYGVSSGIDSDGDGILNQNEFAANTDPTNIDTDGDGANDATDPNPLAAARNIVFSVNMTVQQASGAFNPLADGVVVDFFNGLAGSLPDLALADPDHDGIWTGTLLNFQGPAGVAFGEYKFKNTRSGAPDSGYEGAIGNRTFNLGPANTVQTLPVVFFNDVTTPPGGGYGAWAAANAGGGGAAGDFDGDGVKNGIEYFMGETGSTFTAMPGPVGGTVTWNHPASATGVTYRIWISENLSVWTDVTASAVAGTGTVAYTLPPGTPRRFVRLEVIVP